MKKHIDDLKAEAGLVPGGLNSDGEMDWIGSSEEWSKFEELEATYDGEIEYAAKVEKDEDEEQIEYCSTCDGKRVITVSTNMAAEDDAIDEVPCPKCAY